MSTTVTGPIGATYDAVFDGISATLTRVGGVVGYAETGGAIAPDQKTYVTSGGGVLTMEDLKPGRYTLSLSVPISESTTQTKLWEASGVIQVNAGDNITLDTFLTEDVEPLTPTLVQQAIAARDAAIAAAGEASDALNASILLQSSIAIEAFTGTYIAAASDAGKLWVSATGGDFRLRRQSVIAWADGAVLAVANTGSDPVTITAGVSVSIMPDNTLNLLPAKSATLIRIGEDSWLALGDFE